MRAVIDTNILVSGLLKAGTPPAEVLGDVLSGELVVLYDQRILDEYRDVLGRRKFGSIHPEKIEALLDFILAEGVEIQHAEFSGQLPDPDDQPFADVASTGGAHVLITGNAKHFPVGRALRIVTPREWLRIKSSVRLLRQFGEDEALALEQNEPFSVAVVCKRCGRIRTEEVLGLAPRPEPRLSPFRCPEPDAVQLGAACGGEVWSYDDNDLGRRNAAALGIPVRAAE